MDVGNSKYNIVRDYNKVQGVTHPSDTSNEVLRDYQIRYVNVQNSSLRPIGFAITTYGFGPTPSILKTLLGGEIIHLGINLPDGPSQWMWILDPVTKLPVGPPQIINRHGTDLVLRDGNNLWWMDIFSRAWR